MSENKRQRPNTIKSPSRAEAITTDVFITMLLKYFVAILIIEFLVSMIFLRFRIVLQECGAIVRDSTAINAMMLLQYFETFYQFLF